MKERARDEREEEGILAGVDLCGIRQVKEEAPQDAA